MYKIMYNLKNKIFHWIPKKLSPQTWIVFSYLWYTYYWLLCYYFLTIYKNIICMPCVMLDYTNMNKVYSMYSLLNCSKEVFILEVWYNNWISKISTEPNLSLFWNWPLSWPKLSAESGKTHGLYIILLLNTPLIC